MQGAVLYGPRDVRFEERETPKITKPTDAVIRLSATWICGSDLWPYRGIQPIAQPTPMGHEYCGIVEEVGQEVTKIKPGQFVVGSFATSDNTCAICKHGYQSSCVQREFMSTAQASVLRVPLAEGTLVATNDLPPKELIPSLLTTTLYCKGQQFKENSVSLSVLTKSAERFSLDSLKQDFANKERKLFQDLFFAWDRVDLSDTDILRRHTLGLVLNSVQEYQKADSKPTLTRKANSLSPTFQVFQQTALTSLGMGNG